jgi:hypothetical protein
MATIELASQFKLGLKGVSSCSKILEVVIKVLRQEVQDQCIHRANGVKGSDKY